MGYDVRINCGASIPADKVPAAAKALWEAAVKEHEKLSEADTPIYSTAKDIELAINENLSEYVFRVELCDDGGVFFEACEDCVRHEENDQWIFEAMGPYIDGSIDFVGEDGYKWR